ncbi:MAG TPA: L-2-hydroxyglutarate oxidase [Solirubrobacteraceae bacterium]|jgi:L-2-hydroxyglutarate oxidase LhgO|nr:L-2-hydroxyglutarate oxidase [Solirubrobacteraceae bacterium]
MAERIGVIGAGIVGLAVARRLGELESGSALTVLDKEDRVGAHQTGHNSGVAHAGVYYMPGSIKARLCRRGIELLKPYCDERGIAYDECGKLIVAHDPAELARLDEIERRATANGVPGLKRLAPAQMVEIEPYVRGVAALHSPQTAIVDFKAVTRAYADDVRASGGTVRLGFEVAAIDRSRGELRVRSRAGEELACDRLVVCGGLYSDRLAQMAGEGREPWIVPFRGEYYKLVPARTELVRGLIYPVPDPAYPFLGVHFSRRVDGGVDIGPNAVLAFKREGYRRTDFSAADLFDVFRSQGFRRLARKHWRMGAAEIWGSVSKRAFIARARALIPALTTGDVEPAPAGVRAQALDPDGSLVDDFRITRVGGLVLVRNAPSPAATSSLAIAEYIVDQLRADA